MLIPIFYYRVVSNEVCYPREQRLCEKLVNVVPFPKEKQVCHNDEKKVCELEQRTQPKQVKSCVFRVSEVYLFLAYE